MRGKTKKVERTAVRSAILAALLMAPATPHAEPRSDVVNDWKELRAALARCWQVPAGTEDSSIMMEFQIGPDGYLKGPPRTPARRLVGDADAQQRFFRSALSALDRCQPVHMTPRFKAAQGMTLVRLTLVNRPVAPAITLGTTMTIFASQAGTL